MSNSGLHYANDDEVFEMDVQIYYEEYWFKKKLCNVPVMLIYFCR